MKPANPVAWWMTRTDRSLHSDAVGVMLSVDVPSAVYLVIRAEVPAASQVVSVPDAVRFVTFIGSTWSTYPPAAVFVPVIKALMFACVAVARAVSIAYDFS